MEKSLENYLNVLYKNLKAQDKKILDHFCDTTISDDDYFLYGIKNDIVTNSMNVVINYLSDNLESAGVDNSCRSILEAFTIWKMNSIGDISSTQKSIYRYMYSLVDLDNFKKLLNNVEENNYFYRDIKKARNKCFKLIKKHFNCKQEDLYRKDLHLNDPHLFLQKKLDVPFSFFDIISKYNEDNSNIILMYDFFSIFIHPRSEQDLFIEQCIMEYREQLIFQLLDIVVKFLNDNDMFDNKIDDSDFSADIKKSIFRKNEINVQELSLAMESLIDKICCSNNDNDCYTWFFIYKMKHLLIDMLNSFTYGYKENVIVAFKAFIEQFAIFYEVGTYPIQEFEFLKLGFLYSSRIQLSNILSKDDIKIDFVDDEYLKYLYDNYYKEKYKLKKEKTLFFGLLHNSLYFLNKADKNYTQFVNSYINQVLQNNEKISCVNMLYKISKDMSHASGYNFNSSEGLIESSSHLSIIYSLYFMIHFVLNVIVVQEQHNIKFDYKNEISTIKKIMNEYENGLIEINQFYKQKEESLRKSQT